MEEKELEGLSPEVKERIEAIDERIELLLNHGPWGGFGGRQGMQMTNELGSLREERKGLIEGTITMEMVNQRQKIKELHSAYDKEPKLIASIKIKRQIAKEEAAYKQMAEEAKSKSR